MLWNEVKNKINTFDCPPLFRWYDLLSVLELYILQAIKIYDSQERFTSPFLHLRNEDGLAFL